MYPKYIIKRFNIYYNKEYNMQNLKCLIRRHFPICDINLAKKYLLCLYKKCDIL